MNLDTEERSPSTSSTPSSTRHGPQSNAKPGAPRIDMYRAPHKTLRFLLAKLLVKMGTASFDLRSDAAAVIDELGDVLLACDRHIAHEDMFIRPAIDGRAANAVSTLDAEHAEHAREVAELRALASALREAPTSEARASLGETLYLHFSVFVAETLAHMAYEERVVQPLLDRLFSNEEQAEIHRRLVASIPPPEAMTYLRAMLPASNRGERVAMLEQVRAGLPAEIFAGLMSDLRGCLDGDDWTDLDRRLSR